MQSEATLTDEQRKEEQERQAELERNIAALENMKIEPETSEIYVNIIEARDLKPEDLDGLSDPITVVKAFGKKKHTAVHKKTKSCMFDEELVLTLRT